MAPRLATIPPEKIVKNKWYSRSGWHINCSLNNPMSRISHPATLPASIHKRIACNRDGREALAFLARDGENFAI